MLSGGERSLVLRLPTSARNPPNNAQFFRGNSAKLRLADSTVYRQNVADHFGPSTKIVAANPEKSSKNTDFTGLLQRI